MSSKSNNTHFIRLSPYQSIPTFIYLLFPLHSYDLKHHNKDSQLILDIFPESVEDSGQTGTTIGTKSLYNVLVKSVEY